MDVLMYSKKKNTSEYVDYHTSDLDSKPWLSSSTQAGGMHKFLKVNVYLWQTKYNNVSITSIPEPHPTRNDVSLITIR